MPGPDLADFPGGDIEPEPVDRWDDLTDAPHGQNPELVNPGDVR